MKWDKSERHSQIEYVSGQWSMSEKDGKIFLFNYRLALVPCGFGLGKSEVEIFEDMLKNIAEYEQKLKEIRIEIQDHLAELKVEK